MLYDYFFYKINFFNINEKTWFRNIYLYARGVFSNKINFKIGKKINNFSPDFIWVHELQSSGYMYLKVKPYIKEKFKKNVFGSVWGNDIFYYQDIKAHRLKIFDLLRNFKLLHVESSRDYVLANQLGYSGVKLPVSSITLNEFVNLKVNRNKFIKKEFFLIIKGGYYLRSFNKLFINNIECNLEFWKGKKIFIYNPSDWDIFSYSKLRDKFNLDIKISEQSLRHEFLLEMFRKSKYHISFNLSDGIPNTFLETLFCNSISFIPNSAGISSDLPKDIYSKIVFDIFNDDYTAMIKNIDLNSNYNELLKKLLKYVTENSINPKRFDDVAKISIKLAKQNFEK
tara:strand:- start:72 stop:1091 length:1020 start_codon:yes stop_codon:yes gene_type:complete